MRIWELLASKAEAVKRNVPDATPAVKNACRNSYNLSSATFAKINHTVRTIVIPRVARRTAADEIPASAKEVETDPAVLDANSMKNCSTIYCDYGYGFMTFAKIGYTVRVKGVYRIIHWMKSDGTKSITGIYATNFAENAALHESKDGEEFIAGGSFAMPMKRECMNSYTFGFITFARIGYVVRVNVCRFGQWMADDDTKSTLFMYLTILSKNALRYVLQDCYKLIPGGVGVGFGVALFIILSNTLIDIIHEHHKLSKGKAGSPPNQFSDDLVGSYAMKEFLIFVMNEFISLMMEEPHFFCKGVLTMEYLVFIVREVLVFTLKRHFGAQVLIHTDEIVMAVFQALSFCQGLRVP